MRFVPLILWLAFVLGAGVSYFASRPVVVGRPAPAAKRQREAAVVVEAVSKGKGLGLPIAGLRTSDIQDTFAQTRGGSRQHEAADILAPRGTPVRAMVDGKVRKLFLSKPGGITVYQYDVLEQYCYYYAHLDRYADGLKEGQQLRRGEVLGYVGTTGNANPQTPHLHLAIFLLHADKKWWEGTALNPYPMLVQAVHAEGRP